MSLLDPWGEAGWAGGLGLVREGQGGGDGWRRQIWGVGFLRPAPGWQDIGEKSAFSERFIPHTTLLASSDPCWVSMMLMEIWFHKDYGFIIWYDRERVTGTVEEVLWKGCSGSWRWTELEILTRPLPALGSPQATLGGVSVGWIAMANPKCWHWSPKFPSKCLSSQLLPDSSLWLSLNWMTFISMSCPQSLILMKFIHQPDLIPPEGSLIDKALLLELDVNYWLRDTYNRLYFNFKMFSDLPVHL